jgi:glucose-6-phosphate isomerase
LALARPDPETLGALFLFLECQVAVLGKLWGVNPYDQPGVETGKILAKERLRARQRRRP